MVKSVDAKKMHHDLTNVGLRAQATAAGFLQLCQELRQAGILDQGAIDRIRNAIADEVTLSAPRSVNPGTYRAEICCKLDSLFAGRERLGDANNSAFAVRDVEE